MPRQMITERRLMARLNTELAQGNDSGDHTVSAVMRVEKDDNGCNWAISVMSCYGPFSSAANRETEKVIKALQGLYNLQDGSVISHLKFTNAPKVGTSA